MLQGGMSLYLGKGWKAKPGGMDMLMCKSPPAEISVLGSAKCSRRGKELISPFNLRLGLVGLFAQTIFLPSAGCSSHAVPRFETFPQSG